MGAVVNGSAAAQGGKRKFPHGRKHNNPGQPFNNHPPSLFAFPNMRMRPRMQPPGRLLPPPMGLRPAMGPPPHGMMRPPPFRGPLMRPPPHILRPGPPGMRPIPPPHFMRPPMPPPGIAQPFMGPRFRNFRGGVRPMIRSGDKMRTRHGKIMKKKKPNAVQLDLTKPWINDTTRAEFAKKEELLQTAKGSQSQSDWASYRTQRDKCNKLYSDAKLEYSEKHPEEAYTMDDEIFYSDSELSEEEDGDDQHNNVCKICEREFYTSEQYNKHISKHKTCGIDGCTFTAHEKIVENHINMQHITGLYDKIRNINTPEDIAKWIADRKRKFPTKENIEKRYKHQAEMLKRGERLGHTKLRFDKENKTRFTLNKSHTQSKINTPKRCVQKRKPQKSNSISLINEKSDWNGSMFPFRGTSQFDSEQSSTSDEFEDDEWEAECNQTRVETKTVLTNALGSLISAYNSDSENEVEITPKSTQTEKKIVSDDEPPEEQAVARQDVSAEPIKIKPEVKVSKNKTQKRRRCRSRKVGKTFETSEKRNKLECVSKQIYKKRKITLLERLLANEIKHERNVLLQCVHYIVSNNFFDKMSCDFASQDVMPDSVA